MELLMKNSSWWKFMRKLFLAFYHEVIESSTKRNYSNQILERVHRKNLVICVSFIDFLLTHCLNLRHAFPATFLSLRWFCREEINTKAVNASEMRIFMIWAAGQKFIVGLLSHKQLGTSRFHQNMFAQNRLVKNGESSRPFKLSFSRNFFVETFNLKAIETLRKEN